MWHICLNLLAIDFLVCKNYVSFLGIEILLFYKQCPLKFMSDNTWWSKKVGAKLMSGLVIFQYVLLKFH